jgi:hypothetical protein
MTEIENEILGSLVELENTVKAMRSANPKPNLTPLFARLDRLASSLPKDADPNLRHYLQRKSYEKARLFLQGRDSENVEGACGGH